MDRLTALMHCIQQLGGEAVVVGDRLEIYGGKKLEGGVTVSSYGDHRIAMAVAIGALGCAKPVVITEAESVTKSYPRFYKEFKKLGGVADVIRE